MRRVTAPLRIPDYRRLLISNGLWWHVRWMENIVIGWLVLEMTNSVWHVALIGFFRMAPLLVVGFVSGMVADRFGRRTVILCSQAVNLLVPLSLGMLYAAGLLVFWHIGLAVTILGAVWALDWPTRRSMLPDIVGKKRTVDGMLLEGFFQNISRILGPFSGGALLKLVGVQGCFVVLAALSAVGLLILFGLSKPATRSAIPQATRPFKAIADGLKYIRREQPILGVLLITIVMNNLVFPYMTMLPVFARDVLAQGPVGLGILGACHGVGTFLGLFFVNWIRRYLRPTWIFAGGSIIQSAMLVAFAMSTSFPLSVLLLLLSGFGQSSFGVMQSSIVLVSASDKMRGRTMGALNFSIGVGALGKMEVGALAAAFGAPAAVGLACAASAILVFLLTAALPGFRKKKDL